MGEIEKEKILDILDRFPWTELLNKMNGVRESEIHFSPSLEFENKVNRHGICISIVEDDGSEFYISFKRPKMVTRMFGLTKDIDYNFISARTGQTYQDVRDALTALISDDLVTLEKRWG